jgi:hypothetical protein
MDFPHQFPVEPGHGTYACLAQNLHCNPKTVSIVAVVEALVDYGCHDCSAKRRWQPPATYTGGTPRSDLDLFFFRATHLSLTLFSTWLLSNDLTFLFQTFLTSLSVT